MSRLGPIPQIHLHGLPDRLARTKRCAVNPSMFCVGNDCLSWAIVIPGELADGSDHQGNCNHVLQQSVEIQSRIRQQNEAIHLEQRNYESSLPQMSLPFDGKMNRTQ